MYLRLIEDKYLTGTVSVKILKCHSVIFPNRIF